MSSPRRSSGRLYWLVIVLLLAAEAAGWHAGGLAALALGAVQSAHYRLREGAWLAFPVQVRVAFLGMLAAGLWPPLAFLHWVQLAGTSALLLAGYCPLARTLALMPWNRPVPLSLVLVGRAIFSRPGQGTILQSLYGGEAGVGAGFGAVGR